MPPEAIERCAYCKTDAPVTYFDIGDADDAPLTARIPVCEVCFDENNR